MSDGVDGVEAVTRAATTASWWSTTIPACGGRSSACWRRPSGVDSWRAPPRPWPCLERQEFDLALVDVRLKDGDGYSLCQAIRARRPETDVILITGSISEPDEKLFRSLEEGAFYFLFKPFDRRVLLALVERCLRLQRERETNERYAQALADDLEKARLFQHSLLPREPVAAAGWRVEGRLLSCDALGGDFYLAQAVDGGLAFSVSDVVGHGVSAAMYAGMLRSTLDAARRRGADPERVGREHPRRHRLLRGARLRHHGLRPAAAGRPRPLPSSPAIRRSSG